MPTRKQRHCPRLCNMHLWCLTMQLTGIEQCPKTCNKTVLMVVSGTHSLQAAAVMTWKVMAGLHRTYVDSVSQFMFVVSWMGHGGSCIHATPMSSESVLTMGEYTWCSLTSASMISASLCSLLAKGEKHALPFSFKPAKLQL